MASANTTVEQGEWQVTLTLTPDEASTLRAVCGRIGGIPTTTRRGHTDAISFALDVAGIEAPEGMDLWESEGIVGNITFNA